MRKYIRQIRILFMTSNGFCGMQTPDTKIYLEPRLKLGWFIIRIGMRIINGKDWQPTDGYTEEEADGSRGLHGVQSLARE